MSSMGQIKYGHIKSDHKKEDLISMFLENEVYPLFIQEGLFKSAEFFAFEDAEEQMQGKDVVCTLNKGEKLFIDNKTRWSVVNNNSKKIQSIPFEIRTFNTYGKHRQDGWFVCLSDELYKENIHATDYILAIHPYTKDPTLKIKDKIKYEDIYKLDMLFIRVDDIFAHFKESYNLSFKTVYENGLKFDNKLLKMKEEGKYIPYSERKCVEGFESGIKEDIDDKWEPYTAYDDIFRHSIGKFIEAPLNILIREEVCKQFPHTRHFVYTVNDGITEKYDTLERRPLSKREIKK